MRKVFCVKYQQELPGLEKAPMPGKHGTFIYENVSARAWEEWLEHQKMLINEKHLQLYDAKTREYLTQQMLLFMNNQDFDKPAGFVAPNSSSVSSN